MLPFLFFPPRTITNELVGIDRLRSGIEQDPPESRSQARHITFTSSARHLAPAPAWSPLPTWSRHRAPWPRRARCTLHDRGGPNGVRVGFCVFVRIINGSHLPGGGRRGLQWKGDRCTSPLRIRRNHTAALHYIAVCSRFWPLKTVMNYKYLIFQLIFIIINMIKLSKININT